MKKILSILCLLAFAATVANASLYYLDTDDDLSDGDFDEVYIPSWLNENTGHWVITGDAAMVFRATEARTAATTWYKDLVIYDNLSVGGPYSGDTQVHTDYTKNQGGWKYVETVVDLNASDHYYMVLFDDDVISAGTQYIILDKDTFLPDGTGDWLVFNELEHGSRSGIQWNTVQAIPEPSVIGLMGISGMGLYIARRRNRG